MDSKRLEKDLSDDSEWSDFKDDCDVIRVFEEDSDVKFCSQITNNPYYSIDSSIKINDSEAEESCVENSNSLNTTKSNQCKYKYMSMNKLSSLKMSSKKRPKNNRSKKQRAWEKKKSNKLKNTVNKYSLENNQSCDMISKRESIETPKFDQLTYKKYFLCNESMSLCPKSPSNKNINGEYEESHQFSDCSHELPKNHAAFDERSCNETTVSNESVAIKYNPAIPARDFDKVESQINRSFSEGLILVNPNFDSTVLPDSESGSDSESEHSLFSFKSNNTPTQLVSFERDKYQFPPNKRMSFSNCGVSLSSSETSLVCSLTLNEENKEIFFKSHDKFSRTEPSKLLEFSYQQLSSINFNRNTINNEKKSSYEDSPNQNIFLYNSCTNQQKVEEYNLTFSDNISCKPTKAFENSPLENSKFSSNNLFKDQTEIERPVLKPLKSSDYISHFRQELEEIAEKSISKVSLVKDNIYFDLQKTNTSLQKILRYRLKNLNLQQNQFEHVVKHAKNEITYICCQNSNESIENMNYPLKTWETIKRSVISESVLFENFFPAYAFRENVIKLLNCNRILLINADNAYHFNIVLSQILQKHYPRHFIATCFSSDVQKHWLMYSLSAALEEGIQNNNRLIKCAKEAIVMTEQEMLDYSTNKDYFIKKMTCIILNVTCNRSVTTDILLSNFRDMLEGNKNSKLILLMPPYQESIKYKNFFSKFEIGELKTDDINYPVQVVWKYNPLTPESDYIDEIVRTMLAVCVSKEAGNILTFVASLIDARTVLSLFQKRCVQFNFSNVKVILLDENPYALGDLNLEKEKDVTTIFISARSAETMVLPHVYSVIDCGINTDYFYDSTKNVDVLSTVFISSVRAKLRKKLAGSTGCGVCYRLYSKENYIKDMPKNDYPELFCRNPLNTLIKVFKYKCNSNLNEQFVEFLPEKVVSDSLNALKRYRAIVNNSVSDVGEKIIKLPFEAKYSKLILLGIDLGLAFETVILVSFLTTKGRLFKYSDNPRYQRLIDSAQLDLIKHESDTFTYLHVYEICLKNKFSLDWCSKHYINVDYLNKVRQRNEEICEIILKRLDIKVEQRFAKFDDWFYFLHEALFDSFQENLCVFSGRLECGFRILSSDSVAFLHPKSVTYQKDNVPQFLIFDHILHSDKLYLMEVTAISDDLIMKKLQNSALYFDYDKLFDSNLTEKIIKPVGEEIMNYIFLGDSGEKYKELIEVIKEEIHCDFISVDPSLKDGCVYVYALPKHIDRVCKALDAVIKIKFDELVNECQFHSYELRKDQNSVVLEVEMAKGAIALYVKNESGNRSSELNEDVPGTDTLKTKLFNKYPYSLHVTWLRRHCNGNAFIDFGSKTDLSSIRKLSMRHFYMLDAEIFFKISDEKRNQLHISGLLPATHQNDLFKELKVLFPEAEIAHVELLHIDPFVTSDKRLKTIKSGVTDICKNLINLDSSEVIVTKPNPEDLDYELIIKTCSSEGLGSVADIINTKFLEDNQIITGITFEIKILCNSNLCQALQPKLNEMYIQLNNEFKFQDSLKAGFDLFIKRQNEETCFINVSSSNVDVLKPVHEAVNKLLEGEVLSTADIKDLSKMFCHGGHIWLRALEANENLCIIEDPKRKLIRLYGSYEGCSKARKRLLEFLKDAENDINAIIELSNEKTKNLLLKAVIEEYGVDLKSFIEQCGLQSAFLHFRASRLYIQGNETSIEKANECIDSLLQGLDSINTENLLNQEICPVCFGPAINLTYRLEHCGHLYCQPCIQGLIEDGNFPIKCSAQNCEKELLLKDVWKILREDPPKIKVLVKKTIADYLERHATDVMLCPAPDCSMFFYKNEIIGNKVVCALCQNHICTKCNCIDHAGYSCEMYQETKKDADYSFKVWAKTANCKQCPRCKTAIEKTEGCNHMTCRSCNGHFCWLCPTNTAQVYATGQEVYAHINRHHVNQLFDYQ